MTRERGVSTLQFRVLSQVVRPGIASKVEDKNKLQQVI